jgi:uncharacterized cofD-like protein
VSDSSRPAVAALGGGRGLAVTVAAARRFAGLVTAVVATADDSGSTGRLRTSLAMPAPGDLRRCLVALAGAGESPLGRAFEHRFAGTDVAGHTLGNLLLTGLAAVTGDFLAAVDEAARLLGADPEVGRARPVTLDPVHLRAWTADGTEVFGQYRISQTPGIVRVALDPPDVTATPGLASAVRHADLVVLGPGSVYTSILAAALVDEVHAALAANAARCVYVCNLEPEDAETSGYDIAAHLHALAAHGLHPGTVLIDEGCRMGLGQLGRRRDGAGAQPRLVVADIARADRSGHDEVRLAAALRALLPAAVGHR